MGNINSSYCPEYLGNDLYFIAQISVNGNIIVKFTSPSWLECMEFIALSITRNMIGSYKMGSETDANKIDKLQREIKEELRMKGYVRKVTDTTYYIDACIKRVSKISYSIIYDEINGKSFTFNSEMYDMCGELKDKLYRDIKKLDIEDDIINKLNVDDRETKS